MEVELPGADAWGSPWSKFSRFCDKAVSFAEGEGGSAYDVDFSHSCYPKILKRIIKFNKIFRK